MSFLDRLLAFVHPPTPEPPPLDPQVERALSMMRTVVDPELGIDIVSMGLVREVTVAPLVPPAPLAPPAPPPASPAVARDPTSEHATPEPGAGASQPADAFTVTVKMTLSTRGCPVGPLLVRQVGEALERAGFVDPQVELVWDPPWSPEDIDPAARAHLSG